jgi:hypothetical protein
MRKIVARVLGVCNRNADGHSRQKILEKYAKAGDPVVLNHVLSADGDPNTIEVLLQGGRARNRSASVFCLGASARNSPATWTSTMRSML